MFNEGKIQHWTFDVECSMLVVPDSDFISELRMTVSSHPHPALVVEPTLSTTHAPVTDTRAAWRTWAILIVAIGALYLLMYNPYWVPGGDSELYIAVGRSWATGHGHTFNGQFVSISPPGWPWVLAIAMKISSSFGFLKLITIACMSFTMGFWYWFLLRFATRSHAAMLTLLTAIISHVYSLSFWMHSDAMFCLIATAAMVVACQINERRPNLKWRIALLAVLCVLAQLVRWAGVLQWLVIGGILVRGYALPLSRKRLDEWLASIRSGPWIGLFVSFVVTTGTFLVVRQALMISHEQKLEAEEAGASFDETQQTTESKNVDIFNGKQNVKMTFTQEMIKRVRESGKWFSWLLWPELRFAGGVKLLSSIDTICGWLLIVPLAVTGWSGVRKREWMWLGIAIYCVALCLNWPNPNARYLVPIAPILIWGMLHGIRIIFARYGRLKLAVPLIGLIVASVAIANVALYSVDVWVARSRDFYGRYEGGLDQSLISCVKYLNIAASPTASWA